MYQRQNWTINETLIFLKIVPLAFNTYSSEFSISENMSALVFWYGVKLPHHIFFYLLHAQILPSRRIFSLGNKKKLHTLDWILYNVYFLKQVWITRFQLQVFWTEVGITWLKSSFIDHSNFSCPRVRIMV